MNLRKILVFAILTVTVDVAGAAQPRTAAEMLRWQWSGGRAEGDSPVRLTHFPMRIDDIGNISPMGLMVGGHVTPSDHFGVMPKGSDSCGILAAAAGFIVYIQHRNQPIGDPAGAGRKTDEYRIVFEHSSKFWTYYDNVDELDASVLDAVGGDVLGGPGVQMRVPVSGGQVIGQIRGGHGLDFGVVNTDATLSGFVVPEHYFFEPWKIHTVDPFDYYDEPLRSQLLEKNPRTAVPLGGKIDFDVDGRLVGNWFKEGTADSGAAKYRPRAWENHLSIVYHHIDADKIIVSIGDFAGKVRQFGVNGNAPDPAGVTADSGVVKYEMIYMGRPSSPRPFEDADNIVQGTLLLQLLPNRKLRVESFPGVTAEDVGGFTENSIRYER